jgi:hypothetical protein
VVGVGASLLVVFFAASFFALLAAFDSVALTNFLVTFSLDVF